MSASLSIQLFRESGPVSAAAVKRLAGGGLSGPSTALPYLEQIQRSFGPEHDLSAVRSHVGGAASQAANAMSARAYTTGEDVVFRAQPDLGLAAHEAAHVIQQRAGAAPDEGVGSAGDVYERHAEAVASRVVQGRSARDLLPAAGQSSVGVQRYAEATVAKLAGRLSDDKKAFVSQDMPGGGQALLATKDLVASANTALAGAGQGGSFVRLGEAGYSTTENGQTLVQVLPRFVNTKGDKLFAPQMEEANKPGGKDSAGTSSDWFKLYSDCGRSSRMVMGARDQAPKALIKIGGVQMETTRAYDPGPWTDAVYFHAMRAFLKDPANAKYMQEGLHYVTLTNLIEPNDKAYVEGMKAFLENSDNIPYMKQGVHFLKLLYNNQLSDEACLNGMRAFMRDVENVKYMKEKVHYVKVYPGGKEEGPQYLFSEPHDAKRARELVALLSDEGRAKFLEAYETREYRYLVDPPKDAARAKELFKGLTPEGQTAFREATFIKKSERAFAEISDAKQAKAFYGALSAEGQKAFAANIEINEAVNPNVGEGYTMVTGSDLPGFTKERDTWNFHWAGVVMKAGADNITLENYAIMFPATGDPKKDAENSQKAYDWVNTNWVFQMYGTKKEGQTFHEQHLKSGTHGSKATTFRVKV